MGDMLHFARYDMQWNIERYVDLYINTGVARRVYMGEPRVLVDMSYDDIQKIIPINEVVEMYEPFHKMDVRQFADAIGCNVRDIV